MIYAGLFHRAISVSGSPINKGPLASDQLALAQRQAALLDCPVGSSKDIIACLRTKSAKEIGDTLEGFYVRTVRTQIVDTMRRMGLMRMEKAEVIYKDFITSQSMLYLSTATPLDK